MGTDVQKRPCAKELQYLSKSQVVRPLGFRSIVVLLILLVLPLLASVKLPTPVWVPPTWFLVASIVAWVTYGMDKKAATTGAWRISENRLHFLELIGGWPGAYLGQRAFRHKCSKPSYWLIFWGIVFLYQFTALDVLLDQRFSSELLSIFQQFDWE